MQLNVALRTPATQSMMTGRLGSLCCGLQLEWATPALHSRMQDSAVRGSDISSSQPSRPTRSSDDVCRIGSRPPVGHIVEHRVVEEHRVLGHDCHLLPEAGLLQVPQIDACR